jgi:hypothetical protein
MCKNMKKLTLASAIIFSLFLFAGQSLAWHDKTHLSVAKAAGYAAWYNAAGADIAKIKAGDKERFNHWYNNNRKEEITPQIVLDQVGKYNRAFLWFDAEGHLYGAIIAALRNYEKDTAQGKYGEYHLAYCAHYIGDLSMPLHNTPYDKFNARHHSINDGIVEATVIDELQKVKRHMYKINLRDDNFEADLAREIARIANLSRELGYKMERENRDMTPEEAYVQLGHSASLLQAVLRHYKKS